MLYSLLYQLDNPSEIIAGLWYIYVRIKWKREEFFKNFRIPYFTPEEVKKKNIVFLVTFIETNPFIVNKKRNQVILR